MKLPRRIFLQLTAGVAALPALPRFASALDYPTRPVRIVVGFAPGGGTDLTARLVAEWLSERLGQQFVVENRTGAGSNIATELVVKAAPDGHTLLGFDPSVAINAALYEKLNYDFIRDVAPVALLMRSPLVMEVNPSVAAATVPDFIAYAKAHQGEINFGSGGIGTTAHVAGELFKMMTGVNLVHIPFRGIGPARTALLAGQVQVLFDAMAGSIGYIKAGQVRALAVTSATRSETLPELATVGDFVPGFAADTWYGIGAPKKTPAEIIGKLNAEINAALADPKAKSRFADLGGTVVAQSPEEFGKLIADETDKWAKVVKFSGAKAG
jgi:tripartite-type tricarboxylate transporter receptor subunit TctC